MLLKEFRKSFDSAEEAGQSPNWKSGVSVYKLDHFSQLASQSKLPENNNRSHANQEVAPFDPSS